MKDLIFDVQLFAAVESSSIETFTITGKWNDGTSKNVNYTNSQESSGTAVTAITELLGTDLAAKVNLEWSTETATGIKVSANTENSAGGTAQDVYAALKAICADTTSKYAVTLTSPLNVKAGDTLTLTQRLNIGSGCTALNVDGTITDNSSFVPSSGVLIQHAAANQELTITGNKTGKIKATGKGNDNSGSSSAILVAGQTNAATLKLVGVTIESEVVGINHVQSTDYKSVIEVDADSTVYGKVAGINGGLGDGSNVTINGTVKSDNTAVTMHYGTLTVGEKAVITGGTDAPALEKFDSKVYSVSNCVSNAAIEISPVAPGSVTANITQGTINGGIMLAAPADSDMDAKSVKFNNKASGTTLKITGGTYTGSIIKDATAESATFQIYGGTFNLAAGDYFTDANGVKYTATTASTVTLTKNSSTDTIDKVEFGNTGTVVATLPKDKGLTLDNVQYLSGNDTVTENDTITITNGKVSAVGTGKVKALIGKTAASTNGVTIDGVTYNSTNTTNGGTVVFDNGKASVGTAEGVVTATIAESSKNGVVADNITFTGKNGTVVLTTASGSPNTTSAAVSDESTGTIVATFSATVSTNGITVGKLKYTGAATTDSVTFEKNAYSTSKGNITATTTGALTGDEELKVAGKTYKVTDANTMTFTLKDNVLVGIADLSTTSDSISGDFTSLKTINGATGTITISGDTDVQLVGHATTGQISEVKNVGGNVTISGAAVTAAAITTDNVGSFKLGNTSAITLAGTDSVVGFTLTNSVVTAVTGFDAAGTISGALNGIKFDTATTTTKDAVAVAKDTDFAVINDGSALYLANISDGASVGNAGGMTKAITDSAGTFSFGTTPQKVTVTGDTSVNFTLGDNSTVTAVDSIASATLSVSSDTTSISINGGDAITFTAADKKTPTFVIDGNGKITEVSGASVVAGLTGDVNVIETSSAKIGTTDINITGDTSYAVSVVSGAVGEISSVSANATISMANATVNTDQNGKFTFGGVEYNIAGDNDGVKIVTGADSLMSAVTGLEGTIKTADKTMTINGEEVKIEVASADAASVVTYDGGTAGIDAITGLTNNATVTGAKNAALNLVGTTSTSVATSLTANGNLFQLLNDSDGVTITGGEVVTGLGSGASLVASNAGTYTVNGTELAVAAGETIRGTSEGTAEIYDPSNVAEVNESVAAAVESLAAAIINTEDYEDLSKDTTKLAEVTEAINATSASADKSALNGDMKFAVSVPSGSTSQDVDLSANTGKKDVTLTTGNQSLKFNNEGGNVAEIGKDATGEKTVELGNGGDVVAIAKGADKKATINITAGTGPDTVVSGANASVDVGKGGATKVRAVSGATVTMNNYSAADSKAGVQTTNSDIAAAIGNGNITLENGVIGTSEGKVALNSGSSSADVVTSADSGDTEGSTIANLYNNAGKMTKVGFTHNDGGTVDLSGQKANTVIQGNNAATNKSGESTLLGGSGNDTIFAGSGDAIDAGAGANTIVLKDASSRSSDAEKGATIAMTSATGRNKVQNFNTGFEDGKDAISVDLTNAKFSIDGDGNLIVKNGRAKTTVESAASTSGDVSADATDGVANVLITDSSTGTTTKTAVAGEGKTISVSNDEESFANSYIGDGSGLSFSSYESEVNLNLAVTTATFGGEDVEVSGINNVTLGEADATVFGSDAKETIKAGSGNETIWAGAGKDLLNGFSGNADDKNGAITFGFRAGDGKDTITNFNFLNPAGDNAQTADRVWTTGQFEAALSGNDVILSFNGNKKDSLRITGAKGQNIQLSENGNLESVTTVLQVSDTLLSYDGLATRYVATGSNAAVVASSLASSANIWLEDKYVNLSNNTTYTGKITAVNAAAVEGQATLVGNSYNNVITGAQGSSSMWGGDSTSNDTMIGGTEGNMFFYGVTGGNEGNDSISGVTEDDTVNLFGIQLSDIDLANTSITNSAISLKFNAGGSLTMGNNGQTFMLANDQNQRYTYDKENSQWTKA